MGPAVRPEPLHFRMDVVIEAEKIDCFRMILKPVKCVVRRSVVLQVGIECVLSIDSSKHQVEHQEPSLICEFNPVSSCFVCGPMVLGRIDVHNFYLFVFSPQKPDAMGNAACDL